MAAMRHAQGKGARYIQPAQAHRQRRVFYPYRGQHRSRRAPKTSSKRRRYRKICRPTRVQGSYTCEAAVSYPRHTCESMHPIRPKGSNRR